MVLLLCVENYFFVRKEFFFCTHKIFLLCAENFSAMRREFSRYMLLREYYCVFPLGDGLLRYLQKAGFYVFKVFAERLVGIDAVLHHAA